MRLELDPQALEDLRYWIKADTRKSRKILDLIDAALRDPFSGIGKPEPLKYDLAGCWSRRIDQEHRLVYQVQNEALIVLSCRYHYQ
ncbi:MAG: Txe/YoeB family addiction module toxin [Pseudomonadota bacterium]